MNVLIILVIVYLILGALLTAFLATTTEVILGLIFAALFMVLLELIDIENKIKKK